MPIVFSAHTAILMVVTIAPKTTYVLGFGVIENFPLIDMVNWTIDLCGDHANLSLMCIGKLCASNIA